MFVTTDETLRIFMLKPSTPFSRGFLTPDWHGTVISPASALGGPGRREPPAPVRLERRVQAGLEHSLRDTDRRPTPWLQGTSPPRGPAGPYWLATCLAPGRRRPEKRVV